MARGTYTVTGVKGVVKKLKTLEPKLAKKVIRRAIRDALKPVLARVRSTQPVRTGRTKKATKIYTSRTRKQVIRLRIVVPGRQAAATEWGTKRSGPRATGIRRIFRRHVARGQKGQRFLKRVFDPSKEGIRKTVIDGVLEGVEKVMRE